MADLNKIDIGLRIKNLRGNMTQKDFAELLGVGRVSIVRYETGERMPDAEFLLKIQQKLGVSIEEILAGKQTEGTSSDSVAYDADQVIQPRSANAVIDRLRIALNAKTDSELCKLVDISRPTLGNWRQRDSVPYSLCIDISERLGLSLDWILTGHGTAYRKNSQNEESLNEVSNFSPENYPLPSPSSAIMTLEEPADYAETSPVNMRLAAMADLMDGLSDAQRQEICIAIAEKKRMNEMEKTLEKLTRKSA